MALRHYEPDERGRRPTIEEIGDIEGRAPAVVSRAIKAAFAQRLVKIVRADEAEPTVIRSEPLEQNLTRKFVHLRGALVVREPEPTPADEKQRSDRLHRALGRAMAELLARGALFRDDDRIGVGSGRGVFFTIDALSRCLPLRAENVTVGSLTGSVYAHDHAGLNVMLDADNHAARLTGCFHGGARARLISHPIAFKTASHLDDVRNRTWLSPERWKTEKPSHSLIGVGALVPGHRLHEEANAKDKNEWLSPIADYVQPLVETCDRFRMKYPGYCPVIDLCNRFYHVDPPAGITLPDGERRTIQHHLKRLNDVILTVTDEQLRQIDTIMLVAGGEKKALIIKSLLEERSPTPYRIRYLCTDATTAELLLREGHGAM